MLNNEFYIFGGKFHQMIYNDFWVFNFDTMKWKEITLKGLLISRYGHISFPFDNKVVIYGGKSDQNVELNTNIRFINKEISQSMSIDGFFVDLDQDLFNNLGDVVHSCSYMEDSFLYILG